MKMSNNCTKESEPIRVLQVIGSMNRGGAENMIMNLYRGIDKTKVQFDFLVHTTKEGLFDEEIRKLGGRIFSISRFKGINAFSYYNECTKFFKEHPEHKVVHGHIGSCASLYLEAAKRNRKYTIAHSHSALTSINNLHDLFYRIFSYPTRFIADQLFGCSTEAGIARFGKKTVKKEKYSNFCNAIELKKYIYNEPLRRVVRDNFHFTDNNIVIAHVGRLTQAKNPEMILSVFQEIVEANENAICLWVGTGPIEEKYKNRIVSLGLSNRIIMTGVRSDIPDILQAADCFLFPSLWEGLPVSVIEAQASGLPCVISDTITREVEVSELVEWHGLTESPKVWADRCLQLAMSNREARKSPEQSIIANGYDIDTTSKWLADFYIQHSKI